MNVSKNKYSDFPLWSLIPKRETKIDSFLLQYPQYDGSGTLIAIVDSGVDPGATGLQKTTKGDVKILKRLDCTGCGDVILSEPIEPANSYLNGLSGRKLKVPEKWLNPTGQYRLGCKAVVDLYPKEIKQRLQKEYKEELFRQHTIYFDETNRNLINFEEKYLNTGDLNSGVKLIKEDLEARIEVLNIFKEKFADSGPTYDCVVFHDGTKWNACVDITEEGNLEVCKVLGEYDVTHEYTPLTENDQLNYSINVHNDGKLLELVGISSVHGTNNALMAAGYFEEGSDKNGIAPGAQIVSLAVCDNRLNSAVTGSALVRAIITIVKLAQDKPVIVHSSHGIHSQWSPSTRIEELINEVIDKYRCIWVADAGHHGPALSTVTAPSSIGQDTVIGVSSFVSSEMMSSIHSLRQKMSGMIYTWSSRGPTIDGSFGINICAPGDAVFSHSAVSNCENTSTASAYASGAVALLLSGILSEQKYFSPYTMKRALENGATVLEDIETFAQGHGLLNIENSFEILTKPDLSSDIYARFDINCGSDNSKGIYGFCTENNVSQEWAVSIEPKFIEGTAPFEKLEFNLKLVLECTAPFVYYPKFLNIANMARVISIKVDAKHLKSGAYSTSIKAYNTLNKSRGPVFRIPITVIKAKQVDENNNYTYTSSKKLFTPNTIRRHFFKVPENATWAVFDMNCFECSDIGHFTLHCIQILPKKNYKTIESKFDLNVSNATENTRSFKVEGGFILEVALAKNWDNIGDMNVQYSISFFGIKPSKPYITMLAVDGIHRVDVITLRGEEIFPVITLDHSVRILDSVEAKVKPLSSRDVILPGRQIYELIHTYNFNLTKPVELTLENPYLSQVLHQTEYESHLWMIFNNNKQLLACGDANSDKHFVKLEKGSYTVKSQIRNDKKENLDKYLGMPLLLKMKIPNLVNMEVHQTYLAALLGKKMGDRFEQPLSSLVMPLFISDIIGNDKYNVKTHNLADYLTGTVTFAKEELGKVDTYHIRYVLHRGENVKKTTDNKANSTKTKLDEYKDALKDLKNAWLKKMDEAEEVETLYNEIEEGYPNDLHVHINMLRYLQPMEPKTQLPSFKDDEIKKYKVKELQDKILPLCEKILETLKQDEILCYYASKVDAKEDPKLQESMKLKKIALIESLCHKGISLCRLYHYCLHVDSDSSSIECKPSKNEISDVWETLCKFVDIKERNVDGAVLLFASWHAAINKNYGRLLKFLLRYQEDKCVREIDEKYIEVCELLEWHHLAKHIRRILPSKYPNDYKSF